MRKDLLPYYLQNITIRGFEGDDDKDDKSKDDGGGEDDDDEDDKGGDGKNEDNAGLKSALQKERKAAKDAQRALRQAQAKLDEVSAKDKSETDRAKDDAAKASTKAEKLASKLRETAVDNVVIKLGSKLKFRDIDDALQLINRGEIEIDQDEDDPSDITVDEASVKAALEKLAKRKPHLIGADGQGEPSGSKFNGKKKSDKDADDDALRAKYPALNRSAHTS